MSSQLLLFDPPEATLDLLPFTYTRPTSSLRVGILTICEKWEHRLETKASFVTRDYLQGKYPGGSSDQNLLINGTLCPDVNLVQEIQKLELGQGLVKESTLLAYKCSQSDLERWKSDPESQTFSTREYPGDVVKMNKSWDIFLNNSAEIESDLELLTAGRESAPITDPHTITYQSDKIFLEQGVEIRAAIINASEGPVYIGKDVVIQEGAIVKGPLSIGQGSVISMGSKIRGNVSIGPFCKVGGEVVNSVMQGHSNKGHDGFLGCSVIGEWCNLGADSNTSNMKNNYTEVKLWNYARADFESSGRQFLGLIMGDHSKCGINTMFNTGTVVGVSASIFGSGFPPTFVPSFSWGAIGSVDTFRIEKALEVAQKMMERRQQNLEEVDRVILSEVFEQTAQWRDWE